ncbi:hypothetical protein Rs2_28991 [Raphanus sativus]|nr:hypothetical protein Rs2_28991 [Raphanus sativus]
MAKTRGGGKVGSRWSRRNQGLEVVDQGLEDKRPQLKVKKTTAKKTASPKKSLVLTPTRRSSRIKKVAAQDDEVEDVIPEYVTPDDELEDVTPEYIPRDDEGMKKKLVIWKKMALRKMMRFLVLKELS